MLSILVIACKRLWNQKALMASVALGMLVAVALATSIPLYADAINYRLLRQELEKERASSHFAFMFRYIGAWYGSVEWEDYTPLDAYLTEQAPRRIGIPLVLYVRYVKTDNFRLFPSMDTAPYADRRHALTWVSLGFISGLANHIQIVEGGLPQASAFPLEVLVSQAKAEELGIQVGEQYILFGESGARTVQIPIRIAGVWRPRNQQEPFWFYPVESFNDVFLITQEAFVSRVAPVLKGEVHQAVWYLVFDGRDVRTADVPGLLKRIAAVRAKVTSLLANTSLDASPIEAMREYQETFSRLTVLLYAFGVPVIGLALYFIVLVSGLVVQRQRNEIAVLRSRGASRAQVLGIYLLEGSIVGLSTLVLGSLVGIGFANLMGMVRTFLDFSGSGALSVRASPMAFRFALGAVAVALGTSLLPVWKASRHTIISYKHEVARSLAKPLWQWNSPSPVS